MWKEGYIEGGRGYYGDTLFGVFFEHFGNEILGLFGNVAPFFGVEGVLANLYFLHDHFIVCCIERRVSNLSKFNYNLLFLYESIACELKREPGWNIVGLFVIFLFGLPAEENV